MKNLYDVLSPKSWAFLLAGFYFSFLIIFQPSWLELGVFIAVDLAALGVMIGCDYALFFRRYPVMHHLKDPSYTSLQKLTIDEKKKFYYQLAEFPQRRAWFSLWVSYLVNIPTSAVVLFYWNYDHSLAIQAIKWVTLLHLSFFYMYVVSLLELHHFVSNKIAHIHQTLNWSEFFAELPPPPKNLNVQLIANIGTIAVFFLLFTGQWFILSADPSIYYLEHFFALGFTSTLLILRMLYLERKLLLGGMERVFSHMKQLNSHDKRVIALHTQTQIARFERSFNKLISDLQRKEEEIGLWMLKELDDNRFKVMGEISGLVIHDLATPLHVVNFCINEVLTNNVNLLSDEQFCHHLLQNIQQAKGLLQSFDRFLRNPKDQEGVVTTVGLAHNQAQVIISSQFFRQSILQNLRYEIDPQLENLALDIGPADLLHVFYNLYKNAVTQLASSNVQPPVISVWASKVTPEEVEFRVSDSGPGIAPEQFFQLINMPMQVKHKNFFNRSVGLRLVHTLLKRHQGSLTVHTNDEGKTCFAIVLRRQTTAHREQAAVPLFHEEALHV